ncbi:MAG: helix-turn-helix domain-containing protein [Rhizobiaceae bacterium]|nr:helix-turn-helix domain-containing protein [Rhizobiaceae bacterium]
MKTSLKKKKHPAAGQKTRSSTDGQVQSLTRALSILNAIAEDEQGLTLSEVAIKVGLPPSTAHRHLTTMQQERFVRFDGSSGTWLIGVQAFLTGNAFIDSRDIASLARPQMKRLMETSGETVNLAIADEDQGNVIYLAQVECRHMMRAISRPGERIPMYCTAVGKAILAAMPDSSVSSILRKTGLKRVTDKTITSPGKLREELSKIAADGYAVDNEEHAVGLRCIASVIYNEHGEPTAAISLLGPVARISERQISEFGKLAREAAASITMAIGGRIRTLQN